MALNLVTKTIGDGNGGTFSAVFYQDSVSGNVYPAPVLYDPNGLLTAAATLPIGAGENHAGEIGQRQITALASFTRQANATAYAVGQLISNASPAPLALTAARLNGGSGAISEVRVRKSGATITNAIFRVHLFQGAAAPTTAVADGAAYSPLGLANYLGSVDVTCSQALVDPGAFGRTLTQVGFNAGTGVATIWAFIEARAAYVPGNGETFTVEIVSQAN